MYTANAADMSFVSTIGWSGALESFQKEGFDSLPSLVLQEKKCWNIVDDITKPMYTSILGF